MSRPVQDPFLDIYVEPCLDCAQGHHDWCDMLDNKAPQHTHDDLIHCPCRTSRHSLKEPSV